MRFKYPSVFLAIFFYRPIGAAFYLPLFHFAGLDPFPYRVVIFLLLGLNVVLTWRFAALLTGDYLVAFALP